VTSACGRVETVESRPHVVLIVVDTLRADHVTQYGYPRPTSRALARFDAQATRFERCYATSSWTTPSTASIVTGLSPLRHAAEARGSALSEEAITLAERLAAAGWETAGSSGNHNVTRTTGFAQGFRSFWDYQGESDEYPDVARLLAPLEAWIPDRPVRPVFVYLQAMNVHGPYRVPEEHAADLLGTPPAATFEYSKGLMKRIMKRAELERRAEVDEAYLASHRDQYDTAVRYTLDRLAEFLARLDAKGVYDDALIVITGDHGEELYDHRGFGHGYTLHEEVLRVPLWIKLPRQRSGAVVSEWVSLEDLLPTILDLCGFDPPPSLDGRSLAPLLAGAPAPPPRDPFLSRTRWPGRFVGSAVVAAPWKLVRIESNYEGLADELRLYHLEEDPREETDLAAEHPDVVARLSALLAEREGAAVDALPKVNVTESLDLDVLEALGY